MLARNLTLTVAALLAIGLAAPSPADAGHRKNFRRAVPYDHYQGAPRFVQRTPGLRLFFGDYALSQEEFDALYGPGQDFDESYYEPEPVAPPKPRKQRGKQVLKAPVSEKPKESQDRTASLSPPDSEAAPPKSAARTDDADQPKAKSASSVSCDKAGEIIGGYGFSSVKPESCTGKLYAFNASRGGRNFAIKLDPASGELTEVKKVD